MLLGLLAISLIGLTSCKKEEPNKPQNEGTTYVSVAISMSTGLRAEEDDNYNLKGTWNGKDDIESINVYVVDASSVSTGEYTKNDFAITKATDATNITIVPTKAIPTTAGEKKVYVLINAPATVTNLLNKSVPNEFVDAYNKAIEGVTAAEVAKTKTVGADVEDVILMSNAQECSLTVADGVTEAQALDTTAPQNRADVSVKRVVARVILTTTAAEYDVTYNDGTAMGKVKDITYAVAQGEKSFYLTQRVETNLVKTPGYSFVPVNEAGSDKLTAASYTGMAQYYDYSDLETTQTTPRAATVATTLADALAIGKASQTSGAFLFEATHAFKQAGEDETSYTGGFRNGNTPYVLVRAKFVPNTYIDGETPATDGTFYKGENGRFYAVKENVVNPTKGGVPNQKYYTYNQGKVIYFAKVNPDTPLKPLDAPVYRNNIYHISVTGFKGIGLNWNPLYPEDPDTASPKNPDPKPKDEPLPPFNPGQNNTPKETFMAVDVTVVPWNVHTYEINLGF